MSCGLVPHWGTIGSNCRLFKSTVLSSCQVEFSNAPWCIGTGNAVLTHLSYSLNNQVFASSIGNGTKSLMFSLNQGSRLLHHPRTPSVLCFVKYKSLTQATRLSILFGISLLLSLPCLLKDGGLRGGDAGSHPLTLHTVRVHSAQLITSVPRAQSSHFP